MQMGRMGLDKAWTRQKGFDRNEKVLNPALVSTQSEINYRQSNNQSIHLSIHVKLMVESYIIYTNQFKCVLYLEYFHYFTLNKPFLSHYIFSTIELLYSYALYCDADHVFGSECHCGVM